MRLLREFVAVVLAMVAGFLGIYFMIESEKKVVLTPEQIGDATAIAYMIGGLKDYFFGIGMIFLLVGICWILISAEDIAITRPDQDR